jgi:hypothetical protein
VFSLFFFTFASDISIENLFRFIKMTNAILQLVSLVVSFICGGMALKGSAELGLMWTAIALLFALVSLLFSKMPDKNKEED